MAQVITSPQNQLVKMVRKLQSRRAAREKHNLVVVEGIRLIEYALSAGARVEAAFYTPEVLENERARALLNRLQQAARRYVAVTNAIMKQMSEAEAPQGVLAIVGRPVFDKDEALNSCCHDGLMVMLSKVRDPGNVGTVIRTSDAAGVCSVWLTPGCVDAYNPKVIRASMGSIFRVPVFEGEPLSTLVLSARQRGIQVLAADVRAAMDLYHLDLTRPSLLLFGSEAEGLSRSELELADHVFSIPNRGAVESLNVAMAVAVTLYEAVRQRLWRDRVEN